MHKTSVYVGELSKCTYFFKNNGLEENKVKATLNGNETIIFTIKDAEEKVEACVFIPDEFKCVHSKKGIKTTTFISNNSHLTYHGVGKRKKISGQIHIKNGLHNPLKSQADKTESPIASSKNIVLYPLPICRIELANDLGQLNINSLIKNYFELSSNNVFFNTIKVYIARKGYLHSIASVAEKSRNILSSIFVSDNMNIFIGGGKIQRRVGCYPQAIALQGNKYELIIIANNELVNTSYQMSSIQYFQTKDYFKSICNRNVLPHNNGWFIDQVETPKRKSGMIRVVDLLSMDENA